MIRHFKVGLAVLLSLTTLTAEEIPGLDPAQQIRLSAGECIVLEKRPDETDKMDHRFVTVAAIIAGHRETIWEVINDKENAATFLDGVLESKVVERAGNRILVEQLTHVGGPRGSYRYRLLHELTPMTKADFTYAGGELRNVLGTWWIYDGPAEDSCVVVFSLHIDPGLLAPQAVVKAGMRKTMPKTIQSIAKEVEKRK
jgi:ribosome-associated toxin RatA of RatAB toxin-antitoxin module